MTRYLVAGLVGAALVAGGFLVLRVTGCEPKRTKTEARVDSVLAAVPAWKDSSRVKDSIIAVRDTQRAREHKARQAERARADAAEEKARALQALADTLALIPVGTASDSVLHLSAALTAQRRAAAQFALVVDSLTGHRTKDSLRLVEANETIAEMKSWRTSDLARIDLLTGNLSDLRAETKHAGDWNLPFGIHMPGWTKCVALGAAGAAAGTLVDRDRQARGAVLVGGTAVVGCLVG